jgi:hypothetical protein
MSATSYQQDSRCRPSRVQTASKEVGVTILGVSMSTFTLVHVPYWLAILNISLGSCRPYRRYLSRNRWVRAVQVVIHRFAAYCDGDIGRARHESHACISPPAEGAGPSLVQAFAQGVHTRNITGMRKDPIRPRQRFAMDRRCVLVPRDSVMFVVARLSTAVFRSLTVNSEGGSR